MAKTNEKDANESIIKNNLRIYEQARSVPASALKRILGGRLKGMSDVNPMFRIKRITEIFGPCGFGWKYEIVSQKFETQGQEVKCFMQINLYVKMDDKWSEPIPGVGGSDFVSREKNGLFVNDECEKMALTDALSVAMKALGVAADVYWGKDGESVNTDSKYAYNTQPQQQQSAPQQTKQAAKPAQPAPQPYPELDMEKELLAESEANQAQSSAELTAIWNKYTLKTSPHYHPAFSKDGVFRKAVASRGQQLKAEGK